jgi:ubiquitin-like 1-activating enzyme E1 A
MASFSAAPPPAAPAAGAVTRQESEVYDRQIRLWGIEAQQRLQSSRMLLCGRFSATAAEVGKNLVLAVRACIVFYEGLARAPSLAPLLPLSGIR